MNRRTWASQCLAPTTVVFLFLIVVLNGITLFNYAKVDNRPPAWDESIHTRVTYDYKDRIANEGIFSVLKPAYFNYPPMFHITLMPFINIPDEVSDAGPLINFFYLIFLVISVYLVGRRFLDPLPACTAAFLVTCYPVIIQLTYITMIDLALTAWVTFAFYCLLRSETFTNRNWSIAFGVVLGLAMLTKWTALAYVLFPMGWAGYHAIRQKKWKWLLVSMGVFGAIVGPWYLINLIPAMSRISRGAGMVPASGVILPHGLGWLWYPLALFKQVNLLFLLLFIPGIVTIYRRPKWLPVVLWFIGSLIIFTTFTNRNIRYTMPALPAVALLSLAWIPTNKKWAFPAVNIGILLFFIFFHWVPGNAIAFKIKSLNVPVVARIAPDPGDWKHKAIIEKIKELKKPDKPFTRVLTVSNAPYFHSTSINATLRRVGGEGFAFRGPSKRRFLEFADFILLKTGHLGPGFTTGTVGKVSNFIQNAPEWFDQVYKEVERWPLPDGSEAILYQTNPDPADIPDVGLFNFEVGELKLPRIVAHNVKVRATPLTPEDTKRGRLNELRLASERVVYKRFEFENVELKFSRPQVNLPLFLETNDIQLLELGKLSVNADVKSGPIIQYISRKAKWLDEPRLEFDGGKIRFTASAKGIPLEARAFLKIQDGVLNTRLERVSVLKIPLPIFIARALTDQKVSLAPNRESPFNINVNEIKGSGDLLQIR